MRQAKLTSRPPLHTSLRYRVASRSKRHSAQDCGASRCLRPIANRARPTAGGHNTRPAARDARSRLRASAPCAQSSLRRKRRNIARTLRDDIAVSPAGLCAAVTRAGECRARDAALLATAPVHRPGHSSAARPRALADRARRESRMRPKQLRARNHDDAVLAAPVVARASRRRMSAPAVHEPSRLGT